MTGTQFKYIVSTLIYVFTGMGLFNICQFSGEYYKEYAILLFSYYWVGALIWLAICKRKADIFEPILLVLLLMLCLFSIAPIILTAAGRVSIYGIGFMNGGIKGTIVYILACSSFYLGYYSVKSHRHRQTCQNLSRTSSNSAACLQAMTLIWFVCFAISMWFEIFCMGISLSYILSVGRIGAVDSLNTVETSLSFLINFSYSLIVPWIYIMFKSHSIILKAATTLSMTALYVICGWRFILVMMALSITVVYYVNKNKRPSAKMIVLSLAAALIVITLIGNTRYNLRTGQKTEWSFDIDSMLFVLESNFNLYQPYYGVVSHYPSEYPFTMGEGMILDTLITFIPRALWPGKPQARDFASLRAIRNGIGDSVIDKAAMAMPNIGEMYVDFGTVGVIVIMFLAGTCLRKNTQLYQSKKLTFENLILYSVSYALCFQFVTRGYMPNNFYLMIFVIWPTLVLKKISRNKQLNLPAAIPKK